LLQVFCIRESNCSCIILIIF